MLALHGAVYIKIKLKDILIEIKDNPLPAKHATRFIFSEDTLTHSIPLMIAQCINYLPN